MREKLASLQHDIWAHWMKYLFSQCIKETRINSQGLPVMLPCVEDVCIIPNGKVGKWKKQIDTPYSQLSEKEKESDRHQADKVLKLLKEVADDYSDRL